MHKCPRCTLLHSENEADYRCHLNPLFSRQDLSDFSVASLAVIREILFSASDSIAAKVQECLWLQCDWVCLPYFTCAVPSSVLSLSCWEWRVMWGRPSTLFCPPSHTFVEVSGWLHKEKEEEGEGDQMFLCLFEEEEEADGRNRAQMDEWWIEKFDFTLWQRDHMKPRLPSCKNEMQLIESYEGHIIELRLR